MSQEVIHRMLHDLSDAVSDVALDAVLLPCLQAVQLAMDSRLRNNRH